MKNLILTTTLLTFGITLPALSLPAQQRPPERQVLTVSASGTEHINPTIAEVRLAIEERGVTEEEARNRLAKQSNRLLDFLRAQNVRNLETESLRIHPIFDYTKGDRETVGFLARSLIRFQTGVGDAGKIVDESISHGANQIQELNFTASDSEIEEARLRALKTATRIALLRAESVLAELKLERKQIIRIFLDPADSGPPVPFPKMQAQAFNAQEERAPIDVEPGQPEITASVTLEIAY